MTGKMGLVRNLTPGEILGQVFFARETVRKYGMVSISFTSIPNCTYHCNHLAVHTCRRIWQTGRGPHGVVAGFMSILKYERFGFSETQLDACLDRKTCCVCLEFQATFLCLLRVQESYNMLCLWTWQYSTHRFFSRVVRLMIDV